MSKKLAIIKEDDLTYLIRKAYMFDYPNNYYIYNNMSDREIIEEFSKNII